MLVLTRKSNQSIMIGDDVEISVLAVSGDKVRLGINAPRDVPVYRTEVYLEIQDERGVVTPPGSCEVEDERADQPQASEPVVAGSTGARPGAGLRAKVDEELRRLGDAS